eukprot:COSAG04_NODE_6_length_47123_cov_87.347482_23_plen_132_part_00
MISHAPTLGFLQALLGQRVVCFSFGYDRSEVGTPGLSLHAGAKPFGARVSQSHYVRALAPLPLPLQCSGRCPCPCALCQVSWPLACPLPPRSAQLGRSAQVDNSAPIYLRALYYLDDLTLDGKCGSSLCAF